MGRLVIICEGETELEFCRDVLYPHFASKNMWVHPVLISHSHGGIVKWNELKKQVEKYLKEEEGAFVTTLIDYYGIREKHKFPNFSLSKRYANTAERLEDIENGMKDGIENNLRHRFIPYIQPHEFEGLLFNNIDTFKANFEQKEADFMELEKIITSFPNPEDINNSPDTAPSKRLQQCICGYSKVVYGACLATSIGLNKIRAKCPRFNSWIERLENI